MAADKLVDSTQLDADLTSVANAIRTKGGTSASLTFPADFITAINAISGGGGVTAATGEVTVASDIANPGSTATKVLPGVQLSFTPDFFWFSMEKASWDDFAASAGNGYMYWCAVIKKEMIPTLRTGSSSNTDAADYDDFDFRVLACYQAYNSANSASGYGITGCAFANSTNLNYWHWNNDGTLNYSRVANTSGGMAIKAGKYRYFAVKV